MPPEITPAVIASECDRGDCRRCHNSPDHPCEHNCHMVEPPGTTAQDEVRAIGMAYDALRSLDSRARERALRWLKDRLDADEMRAYNQEPPF